MTREEVEGPVRSSRAVVDVLSLPTVFSERTWDRDYILQREMDHRSRIWNEGRRPGGLEVRVAHRDVIICHYHEPEEGRARLPLRRPFQA